MKKQFSKMNLKKVTIVQLNNPAMQALRGGSSIPTDSENPPETHIIDTADPDLTFNHCDSNGR